MLTKYTKKFSIFGFWVFGIMILMDVYFNVLSGERSNDLVFICFLFYICSGLLILDFVGKKSERK